MSKEHAGGIDYGGLFRVPAEWSEEQRVAVKIDTFNFEDLDSVDDLVREELATKGTVRGLIHKLVALQMEKARTETAVRILGIIIQAEDSGLSAVCLSIASGMIITAEESMTEYAAQFGVSKQDVQQLVKKYQRELGLRKTRNARDEEACALMSQTNFRRQASA